MVNLKAQSATEYRDLVSHSRPFEGISSMPVDVLGRRSVFGRSSMLVAQHRLRELLQPRQVEDLELAAIHAQQALVLEAAHDARHGFGREPEVIADVGARHAQHEARRREAAAGEAARDRQHEAVMRSSALKSPAIAAALLMS